MPSDTAHHEHGHPAQSARPRFDVILTDHVECLLSALFIAADAGHAPSLDLATELILRSTDFPRQMRIARSFATLTVQQLAQVMQGSGATPDCLRGLENGSKDGAGIRAHVVHALWRFWPRPLSPALLGSDIQSQTTAA